MPKGCDNDDDLEVKQTSNWVVAKRNAPSPTATTPTNSERAEHQHRQQQDEVQSSSQAATDALAEAKPREQKDHTETPTSAIFDVATTASTVHSAPNPKDAPEEEMMNTNHKLPFPWKLHMLLDEAQRMGYQDIVSWDADGNSFRVHKPIEFCESILVRYFRQSKYESFTRQCERLLNRPTNETDGQWQDLPFLCRFYLYWLGRSVHLRVFQSGQQGTVSRSLFASTISSRRQGSIDVAWKK
jgi:hypothetical protein